jgi:hypothetical protein
LAPACLAGFAFAQSPPHPIAVQPPPIATAYQCNIVPSAALSPGGGLKGAVRIDTLKKELHIKWSFEIGGFGRDFDTQTVALGFWPTAAAFTKDKLVVAGRTIKYKTRIRVIEFSYPSLPATPDVEYAALIASNQGIYDDREPGRIDVKRMWANLGWPGPSGAVFVQFRSSGNVELLDLQTNSLSVAVLGASQPLLASERYIGVSLIGHPQHGLLYLFSPQPNGLPEALLLFVDSNSDGVIDQNYSPTKAEWHALVADPSQLVFYD